ncbi:hypothetical protein GCM10009678_54440 [Actinomadura kijaniata]|uniref:RNA polymerase alpha subunit C-terminal domain-containing protein n=1 Tax=Actinomadura namibiensis TaxID=182080 RepID=A0A7W3LRE7_ACTNM|nr:hypothetical protein [Actinomadura namibiensis]MBA8952923.1 hypothetical protein [Actinomadura namibiensis]
MKADDHLRPDCPLRCLRLPEHIVRRLESFLGRTATVGKVAALANDGHLAEVRGLGRKWEEEIRDALRVAGMLEHDHPTYTHAVDHLRSVEALELLAEALEPSGWNARVLQRDCPPVLEVYQRWRNEISLTKAGPQERVTVRWLGRDRTGWYCGAASGRLALCALPEHAVRALDHWLMHGEPYGGSDG